MPRYFILKSPILWLFSFSLISLFLIFSLLNPFDKSQLFEGPVQCTDKENTLQCSRRHSFGPYSSHYGLDPPVDSGSCPLEVEESGSTRHIVLWYNKRARIWWPESPYSVMCNISGILHSIRVTNDRSCFKSAEFVIWHGPDLESEILDAVLGDYWCGMEQFLPKRGHANQRFILYTREGSVFHPLTISSHLKAFDAVMGPQTSADYRRGYGDSKCKMDTHRIPFHDRDDFPVLWVASNCKTPNSRIQIVENLMKFIPIHSYGKCLQNGEILPNETLNEVIAGHKFYLAFENSLENGYVSEKFYRSLHYGSIPVYYGAPDIARYAPSTDSFIDFRQFCSLKSLAGYLIALSEDAFAYQRFFEWKKRPDSDLSPNFITDIGKLDQNCVLFKDSLDITISRSFIEDPPDQDPQILFNDCDCDDPWGLKVKFVENQLRNRRRYLIHRKFSSQDDCKLYRLRNLDDFALVWKEKEVLKHDCVRFYASSNLTSLFESSLWLDTDDLNCTDVDHSEYSSGSLIEKDDFDAFRSWFFPTRRSMLRTALHLPGLTFDPLTYIILVDSFDSFLVASARETRSKERIASEVYFILAAEPPLVQSESTIQSVVYFDFDSVADDSVTFGEAFYFRILLMFVSDEIWENGVKWNLG